MAVAAVAISRVLCAVLHDRVATPHGPVFRQQSHHRNGHDRLRACGERRADEIIRGLSVQSVSQRFIRDILEVEILAAIGGADGPVVAAHGVAAPAIDGDADVGELVRVGEGDAVDARIDRVPIHRRIDVDRNGRVQIWCASRRRQQAKRDRCKKDPPHVGGGNGSAYGDFQSEAAARWMGQG